MLKYLSNNYAGMLMDNSELRNAGKSGLAILDNSDRFTGIASEQPVEVAGLCNPKVIDTIRPGVDETVEFHFVQELEWGEYPDDILRRIEEKLNNYVDYVVDGFFARHYPQYRGKQVNFVFNYRGTPPYEAGPPAECAELLAAFARFSSSYGIRFITRESSP
jgi:hypothetical protein